MAERDEDRAQREGAGAEDADRLRERRVRPAEPMDHRHEPERDGDPSGVVLIEAAPRRNARHHRERDATAAPSKVPEPEHEEHMGGATHVDPPGAGPDELQRGSGHERREDEPEDSPLERPAEEPREQHAQHAPECSDQHRQVHDWAEDHLERGRDRHHESRAMRVGGVECGEELQPLTGEMAFGEGAGNFEQNQQPIGVEFPH